jgi:hypothetical protein
MHVFYVLFRAIAYSLYIGFESRYGRHSENAAKPHEYMSFG